jgi:hypothetical protein
MLPYKHYLQWMSILGIPVFYVLIAIFRFFLIHYRRQKKNKRILVSFYQTEELKKMTRFYIPTRFQFNNPADSEDLRDDPFNSKTFLLDYCFKELLSKNSDNKFYLILGETGIGKTIFMIHLYLKCCSRFPKNQKILFYPLANSGVEAKIDETENNEIMNSIVLLDSFDEYPPAYKDWQLALNKLLEKFSTATSVFLTCRTHFFSCVNEEPSYTLIKKIGFDKGFEVFKKIYISPFNRKDVLKYIIHAFGFIYFLNRQNRDQLEFLFESSISFLIRPMVLPWIKDLLRIKSILSGAFELYQYIIEEWLTREAKRWAQISTSFGNKKPDYLEFKAHLNQFSIDVSWLMFEKIEQGLPPIISSEEIEKSFSQYSVLLNYHFSSSSLLTRNADGNWKFSHKSFFDFYLALLFKKGIKIDFNNHYYEFTQRLLIESIFLKKHPNNTYNTNERIIKEYLSRCSIDIEFLIDHCNSELLELLPNIKGLMIKNPAFMTPKNDYITLNTGFDIAKDQIKRTNIHSILIQGFNIVNSDLLNIPLFENIKQLLLKDVELDNFSVLLKAFPYIKDISLRHVRVSGEKLYCANQIENLVLYDSVILSKEYFPFFYGKLIINFIPTELKNIKNIIWFIDENMNLENFGLNVSTFINMKIKHEFYLYFNCSTISCEETFEILRHLLFIAYQKLNIVMHIICDKYVEDEIRIFVNNTNLPFYFLDYHNYKPIIVEKIFLDFTNFRFQ